jgi:glutamyl-tRNA reductase
LGLDAQVLGDQQICGQVKQAYQWSADADAAGLFLHRLLHTVFFAHKRVRQETDFHTGAASVAHAARTLVEDLTAHLPNPRVLVVGAGGLGADVAREFSGNRRFSPVTLCNRTSARAAALAAELGLAVLDFADLARGVQQADVVISCVAAPVPPLTRRLLTQRPVFSHKYLVDLSVPRGIEAAVEEVPGVLLYTLDDIHPKTTAAEARRRAAVPQVRVIIAESMADLREWSSEAELSPTIQLLKNALEQLRHEEVQRFGKKISLEQAALLDEVTRSLMQKVLKQPVRHLKAACKRGETAPLVELLTDLFDLEKQRALSPLMG